MQPSTQIESLDGDLSLKNMDLNYHREKNEVFPLKISPFQEILPYVRLWYLVRALSNYFFLLNDDNDENDGNCRFFEMNMAFLFVFFGSMYPTNLGKSFCRKAVVKFVSLELNFDENVKFFWWNDEFFQILSTRGH